MTEKRPRSKAQGPKSEALAKTNGNVLAFFSGKSWRDFLADWNETNQKIETALWTRAAIVAAFQAIHHYEHRLMERLIFTFAAA